MIVKYTYWPLVMLLLCVVCNTQLMANIPHSGVSSTVRFIENKGQWPQEVLFKADIPAGALFITNKGLYYSLYHSHAFHEATHAGALGNETINGHAYRVQFDGGKTPNNIITGNRFTEYYNYFIGNDKSKWRSNCYAYDQITLTNVYTGIDIQIIGKEKAVKINFIVHPSAKPSDIKLLYEGQNSISLLNGELRIGTSVTTIKEERPYAYQQTGEVFSQYLLNNNSISFNIGKYDASKPLVIDPNVIFSTFSGSLSDNFGNTATFDESGNAWSGGTVYGVDFPTTLGAFQFVYGGGANNNGAARDIGLLKFSADGKQLICATYLGGSNNEQPHSLICNPLGDVYILGTSYSTNFPTSPNAFDKIHNGGADIVITQLSADGKTLQSSTFFGGVDNDGINGTNPNNQQFRNSNPLAYNYGDFYRGEIQFDNGGNIVIASATQSSVVEGFPLSGAFQNTFGGGTQDGCVFKLTPNLSSLLFSTYLGGSNEDAAMALVVDSRNTIYVTGGTASNNLQVNAGTQTYKGAVDGFVARISPSNTLTKFIYVGTTSYDQSYFIALDNEENIYITGQTKGNFLVKGNVYRNTGGKQFIMCLSNNLDTIKLSTVYGTNSSTPNISPSGFMVDACGRVYVAGWGGSTNELFNAEVGRTTGLPVTTNAFQKSTDGSDFYLMVFRKDLASLDYATFYGGVSSHEHVDGGTSRFDRRGVVFQSVCAGCGGMSDFPTTLGAYSRTNNSDNCNNAVFKIDLNTSSVPPVVKDTLIIVSAGTKIVYPFRIFDPDNDSLTVTFSGNLITLQPNKPNLISSRTRSSMDVLLTWETLCGNATLLGNDTPTLIIEAVDDGCFVQNKTIAKIQIVVLPLPKLPPPFPQCLKTLSDDVAELRWNVFPNEAPFKSYIVSKRVNQGAFTVVDTIENRFTNFFTDYNAKSHLTDSNICYYVQSINVCDSPSNPSRLICSLFQYDTTITPTFKTTVDTTLFVNATDTLLYRFSAFTNDPLDSIFLNVSGNCLSQNRLLTQEQIYGLHEAAFKFSLVGLCSDIGRTDTLKVDIFLRDNQCPQSKTLRAHIKIVVTPPPTDPPPTLKCTRDLNEQTLLIRWDKTNVSRYFSHYVLIRKTPAGLFETLAKVYADSAFNFIDNKASSHASIDYCYSAYAVNICDFIGDTGLYSCSVTKSINLPNPTYIYTTTVEKNKDVRVFWQKSNDIEFYQYHVLKKEKNETLFKTIKVLDKIKDTTYLDTEVEVQKKSYCYKILQRNDCGALNTDESFSCSILLKGTTIPFKHTLNWSAFDYFKNGVDAYWIYRSGPEEETNKLGETFFKDLFYIDQNLNINNGLYYYTVEAIEHKSSFSSVSNTIELIQKPIVYVPNAYTPNNDGNNDTWKTVPVFVKDYHLKLYDRWGKLIFETQNKYQNMKDEILNDPATIDVFVYVLTYTGWDGSSHSQKGNVTILR